MAVSITLALNEFGLEWPRPGWEQAAHCANLPPATADRLFLGPANRVPAGASDLCDWCPVWRECLAGEVVAVLASGARTWWKDVHGVRANLAASEREVLLRDAVAATQATSEAA